MAVWYRWQFKNTYSSIGSGVSIAAGYNKSWHFSQEGDLTIPGDIKSQGNINIDINLADSTLRRWQFGEDGILTLPSTGKISNSDYDWTFSADGRTTFPNGVVPEHSYGAAGDKEGMVVFTDPYIYYCKQDYVNNTTDIWVRVAWTGTNW